MLLANVGRSRSARWDSDRMVTDRESIKKTSRSKEARSRSGIVVSERSLTLSRLDLNISAPSAFHSWISDGISSTSPLVSYLEYRYGLKADIFLAANSPSSSGPGRYLVTVFSCHSTLLPVKSIVVF